MKAYGKNLRISPKKLRVIAEVVKGNDASEALNFLRFAPKKWAKLLYWVLRGNPVSRWRMHPILKRTSNVKLELQVK